CSWLCFLFVCLFFLFVLCLLFLFFFFFSSRRRHTRCLSDWSSDVCSSDLLTRLATEYAVFNGWFSSIPGPTICNRAFAHYGTSFGNVDMNLFYIQDPIQSIYERIVQAGLAPFYFQPTPGGADINSNPSLGSYQDLRFRAPNVMLLRQSFEHSVWNLPLGVRFMADEGKVALTRGDLGSNPWVHS